MKRKASKATRHNMSVFRQVIQEVVSGLKIVEFAAKEEGQGEGVFMFRIAILLLLLILGPVSLADKCQYCPSTAPLYKVDAMSYCNKHYCSKHKAIHKEPDCRQCELASLIKRKKARCLFCDNMKDLVVAKYGRQGFNVLCQNHYGPRHRQILVDAKSGDTIDCPVCHKIKKAEQDVVELNKQREDLIRKREEIYKTMAEPLKGIFGIQLKAPITSIKAQLVDRQESLYIFTPAKQFRSFELYFVQEKGGLISSIMATSTFTSNDAAQTEFLNIINIMDRKYGSIRRGEEKGHGVYGRRVFYDFACDAGTVENPKQQIRVIKEGSPTPRITIIVLDVDDIRNENRRDMEAL